MDPAQSWGRLASALIGPYEREIVGALVGAYQSLEGRIEVAYKRALDDGSTFPLQRLLLLRDELGRELNGLALPPELQQTITRSLADGQLASDYWALAELNRVQQQAQQLGTEQAAQLFADAATNPEAILSPAMAQQNPSALIAAAQRENALRNYAAGSKGSQVFGQLNRLADVDLRGRIIGAVEFHLAQSDSWRQLKGTLTNSLAISSSRAQTLARTEMSAAMVEGTKLRYEAEGIKEVQWQAVGSSRACVFCAPRHRRVYRLGEVVCPAHPNCRCALTPWDPEWVELGLVDRQEEAKERAEVMDELRDAGKEPNYGPSPFERALGREEAAEAVWMPPRAGSQTQAVARPKGPSVFEFARDHQFMNAKAKLSPEQISDSLALLAEGDSLSAQNMRKMLQFQQKKNISTVWSDGREKVVGPDFNHWKDPTLIQSLRDGIARGGKGQGIIKEIADDLDKGQVSPFLGKLGRVSSGSDGHTTHAGGFIALKQGSHQVATGTEQAARIREAVVSSVEAAATGKPKQVAYADLWEKTGKTTWKSKEGWAVTYVHEMGHQVHFAANTPGMNAYLPEDLRKQAAGSGPAAIEAIGKLRQMEWKPSTYGATNGMEQFAETFVQFVYAPEELKKASPAAYAWIEGTLNEAMK
jgi:SPP1 gp7 family putative phage head morphogenesis protein